jgi:glycosyltransferase involved in cell wall biosynthesis
LKTKNSHNQYRDLSFITIGLCDNSDLEKTYESIEPLLAEGASWVLIISKGPVTNFKYNVRKICGQDSSLYNALNIGIENIETEYFMFLHSGDLLINHEAFLRAYLLFEDNEVNCVLGGSWIGKRMHLSKYWHTRYLRVLVQPPHLPILYRTSSVGDLRFDESIDTVADFYFLNTYFPKISNTYVHSKEIYVRMAEGGLTTSGVQSFIHVSKCFFKVIGLKAFFLAPLRALIKIVLK